MQNEQLFKQSVHKIADSLQKEVPILEDNLKTLQADEGYFTLPIIMHNISVIFEREAYKFLPLLICLYRDNNEQKTKLLDIQRQEDGLVAEQYKIAKAAEKQAQEENIPFDIQSEIDYFNHVEGDFSLFLSWFMENAVLTQAITDEQEKTLKDIRILCLEILNRLVPLKQEALKNVLLVKEKV